MTLGAYEIFVAEAPDGGPGLAGTYVSRNLLRIAFRDRLITDLEPPRHQATARVMPEALGAFREVVAIDFEFAAPPGERPARSAWWRTSCGSRRVFRRVARMSSGRRRPYATGPDVLFVAYYASAELGCHRALGWPMPARILDLFAEFRDRTNGLPTPAGAGLLGALTYFGLDAIGATEKEEMRDADHARRTMVGRRARSRSSTTAQATSTRWSACCRPCCRASTCRARCCAAATWPPPPPWSTTACRSTSTTLARLREHWTDIQDELIADIDRRLRRLRRPHFQGRSLRRIWLAGTASRGRGSRAASST